MMFGILGRYFFKRYALIAFWFIAGTASLVFFVDFSEVSGRMSALPGYTVTTGILMTAVRLPTILQQTLPFIALFVGMTALLTLNRRYELVVTRAAGVSVWQFMGPLLIGAILLGIGGAAVLNPLAAWGSRKALDFETVLRGTASADGPSILPWLRQSSGAEDTIIGARTIGETGSAMFGVTVIHLDRDGNVTLRQDADSAKLEDGYWLLKGVTEVRPGEQQQKLAEAKVRTNLKQEFMSERMTQPETIGFFDLPRKIEVAKSLGISPKALQTQFHSLVSLPLLLVAMTLIAASVCLKFSRFNQSRSVILGGILSGFVLYVVTVLIKAFGSSGVVPPFVAAWLPVVVAMALGSTILLHQEDG